MSKGIAIILTVTLLAASMVILYQYNITGMSSTAQGVNLTNAPVEIQEAYQASTHTTVTSIAVSHYTVLLVGLFAVIISLVVLVLMVQANRKKAGF